MHNKPVKFKHAHTMKYCKLLLMQHITSSHQAGKMINILHSLSWSIWLHQWHHTAP